MSSQAQSQDFDISTLQFDFLLGDTIVAKFHTALLAVRDNGGDQLNREARKVARSIHAMAPPTKWEGTLLEQQVAGAVLGMAMRIPDGSVEQLLLLAVLGHVFDLSPDGQYASVVGSELRDRWVGQYSLARVLMHITIDYANGKTQIPRKETQRIQRTSSTSSMSAMNG